MSMEDMKREKADMRKQKDVAKTTPKKPTVTEHTVVSGESLSLIAQKYYNSAEREKWMAIYEANKEIIGDNPSLIRVGQVLQIPTLPA